MNTEEQRKTPGETGTPPSLDWLDGDVPRAGAFDDTYFSKAGGLSETRHVFLGGNDLPDRFETRTDFTIAEFGFGTGLNFLTTLAALSQCQKPPQLTFISFELYPMTSDQLERALGAFSELEAYSAALLDEWQVLPGWNRLKVCGADLLLGIGDARLMIDGLSLSSGGSTQTRIQPVDAWYLDGFSPAKNPQLWEDGLLKKAANLTAPGGTLATYTSAGWVRRNLQSAGFEVEKTKGFAGKREMVTGKKPV
ncbi:tRNA 5-methylaminomethyl-2-thiouridine synthase [Roseibium denhamense]|uniref:tRNA U34 5-methylaminomethyl-2-thiouridine-forming methyltransferase MnmC n=1 Tax=Roseibium denhamense TaxID=76305 RepID=A0ABY1PPY0_9HYPH|nr:tRNA (5-methylaminomethyl-2-thiouridine)(34)-methyltransferase MnmD [Roseibium denhamense]MTI04108.1 tRNA 5-methylaminomethyl-2-thiouridine synthase [Roseibium denhamense]SMP37362.1 tRNA U34 5-methylaminomethyl-2-thiouridine-forming methyltransferase MnmC [Roseibium denhamense]